MSIQLFFFPFLLSDYFCSVDILLFLVAVINPPLHFLFSFLVIIWRHRRDLECWRPTSFFILDTYSLSTSSLGCKALCIVMSLLLLLLLLYSFRVFHIRVNWWFYTGVWVTESLLKSPGLLIIIVIIIIIIIIYSLRVFLISVSWWSFTGVWVTANVLKCLGPFSVFWSFSIM